MNNLKIFYSRSGSNTIIHIPTSLKREKAELAIFDILGHQVAIVSVRKDNTAVIESDTVCNGTYFYHIFKMGKLLACGKLAVE